MALFINSAQLWWPMPVDPKKEVESAVGIGEDGKVETYQFSLNEDKSTNLHTNHFHLMELFTNSS